MKRIVLGCAMLFAVTCAKANDVTVDNAVVNETVSVLAETETAASSAPEKAAVTPECYALSCGTFCDGSGDLFLEDEDNIEQIFESIEDLFC